MKRKWFFKSLCLICASLMVLSVLAACGAGSNSGTETTKGGSTTQAETSKAEVPVIDVTIMENSGIKAISEELVKGDRIKNYVQDKLKINLKNVPINGELSTLQLSMASKEEVDIYEVPFFTGGVKEYIRQAAKDGILLDTAPIVAAAPEKYSTLSKIYQEKEFKFFHDQLYGTSDSIYGYVSVDYAAAIPGGPAFNMKLLNKYGLKLPTTVDEFVNLLRELKKNDKNIIPFAFVNNKGTNWGGELNGEFEKIFFNTQGAFISEIRPDKDGVWFNPVTDPKNKEIWKQVAGYYKEGLIDKEIITKDAWVCVSPDFFTGKTAVVGGLLPGNVPGLYAWYVNEFVKANPGSTFADVGLMPQPLTGSGGKELNEKVPYSVSNVLVIPANVKDKERIVEVLNYIVSTEGRTVQLYGLEGIHYTKDGSGNFVRNMDEWKKDTKAIWDFDFQGGTFPDMTTSGFYLYDVDKYGWYKSLPFGIRTENDLYGNPPELTAYWAASVKQWQEQLVPLPVYYNTVYSEAEDVIKTNLKTIRDKYYSAFLIGTKDVDKEWDNFVKEYQAAGVDILVRAKNKLVAESKLKWEEATK